MVAQRMLPDGWLRPPNLPLQELDEIQHFPLLVRRQQKQLRLNLFYGTHFAVLSGEPKAFDAVTKLYTSFQTAQMSSMGLSSMELDGSGGPAARIFQGRKSLPSLFK